MAVPKRKQETEKGKGLAKKATGSRDAGQRRKKKALSGIEIIRPVKSDRDDFYIAGIGASAGGLEAFQEFFTHMPSDSGMSFVLVPHLDPAHKSIIGDILKKYTEMNILHAEDRIKVLPNCVYLIQPDKNIAALNGSLQLKKARRFILRWNEKPILAS
jgi:two-component system CheB/CheR fusion protein